MKPIIGLMQPDQGHVFVRGKDITALSGRDLSEVRRSMGFLFQNAALFDSITVGENVAFPLRRHTDWPDSKIRETARAKLAEVGLEDDYDKMPAELSGGMRKRAGPARAMALDPDILLVDEPSAGLDPITAGEIDQLLVDLKKHGTTLVVVTHNIPSARHIGDELAVLHDGRVIARGTAEELDRSDTGWSARSCGRRARDDLCQGGRRRRVRPHRPAAVRGRALPDRRPADAARAAGYPLHRGLAGQSDPDRRPDVPGRRLVVSRSTDPDSPDSSR